MRFLNSWFIATALLVGCGSVHAQGLVLYFANDTCEEIFPMGISSFIIRAGADDQGMKEVEFAVHGIPDGYLVMSIEPHPAATVEGDPFGNGARVTFDTCQQRSIDLFTVTIYRTTIAPVKARDVSFVTTGSAPGTSVCPTLTNCNGVALEACHNAAERLLDDPKDPVPADGATNVALDAVLAWTSPRAPSCWVSAPMARIYFGLEPDPTQGTYTYGDEFTPGLLLPQTTYYWRVVRFGAFQYAESPVWSFTTSDVVAVAPTDWSAVKRLFRE